MTPETKDISLKYAFFEDEEMTRIFIEDAIHKLRPGYCKITSSDSALQIGKLVSSSKPDFIISGVVLSDGVSIGHYRKNCAEVPLIFYTAYPHLLKKASDLNVIYSAAKPISYKVIKQTIACIESALLDITSDKTNTKRRKIQTTNNK